jgi:hypothetical protein
MPPSLEHKSRGSKELERGPGGSVSDSGTPASGSAALPSLPFAPEPAPYGRTVSRLATRGSAARLAPSLALAPATQASSPSLPLTPDLRLRAHRRTAPGEPARPCAWSLVLSRSRSASLLRSVTSRRLLALRTGAGTKTTTRVTSQRLLASRTGASTKATTESLRGDFSRREPGLERHGRETPVYSRRLLVSASPERTNSRRLLRLRGGCCESRGRDLWNSRREPEGT